MNTIECFARRWAVSVLSAAVLLTQCNLGAFAFSAGDGVTKDYSFATEGGKYLFVMLIPNQQENGAGEASGLDLKIRETYDHSGLYLNDGSTSPLWTVDWYATEVYVSSDSQYCVRIGPWPTYETDRDFEKDGRALGQLAVAFYRGGKKVRDYDISQLIHDPKKLPRGRSHFQWRERIWLDESALQLNVITHDEQKIVFDLKTGKVVDRQLPEGPAALPKRL